MKQVIAILVATMSLAVAQGQTAPSAQEQLKAATLQMQKQIAEAQARALTNKTARVTNTEPIKPRIPIPQPDHYFNTNYSSPGFGLFLRHWEKSRPGVSTNFTAAQRALTNATPLMPWDVPRPSVSTNSVR